MTIRKTVKNWAEMSLNVVDFKIFRFQLELCFAASFFFSFLLQHCARKLFTRILLPRVPNRP